jgi:glutamine synthetase
MSVKPDTHRPIAALDPERLEADGYETVIVAAPDMQGRLFGRRMPPTIFLDKLGGIEACKCTLAWDIEQDLSLQVDFAGFDTGWPDLTLAPDLATLRPLGWMDGVALCFADVVDEDGAAVPIAPRNLLKKQVERLAGIGYQPFLGSELEFFLYRSTPEEARKAGYQGLPPTTRHHADYLIAAGNETEAFFRRLRKGLEPSGVILELGQVEWGLGQWEIGIHYDGALTTADAHVLFKMAVKDLAARDGMIATFMARPSTAEIGIHYDGALTTADAHVLFKMAVKDLAARDGMIATFMARPSTAEIGSSGHIHCSLRGPDSEPVFYDDAAADRLSTTYRWAVGGILDHAPELMVWYAPTVQR